MIICLVWVRHFTINNEYILLTFRINSVFDLTYNLNYVINEIIKPMHLVQNEKQDFQTKIQPLQFKKHDRLACAHKSGISRSDVVKRFVRHHDNFAAYHSGVLDVSFCS